MPGHRVDYTIIGEEIQTVEIGLDPGQAIIAEAGVMNYIDDDIKAEARMGDGSPAGENIIDSLIKAGRRLLSGDSLFITHFTNTGENRRGVAFSAPWPGKIVALNLAGFGGEVFCQKDAFLCAADGTRIEIAFNRRLGAGLFNREGFTLLRLIGDGPVFIHAGGAMVEKTLKNETIKVDTGCIAAFTTGLDYGINEHAGSLKSMLFGGEALFPASLSGTGTVFLQTLPLSRLADRLLRDTSFTGGRHKRKESMIKTIRKKF